jgi:phytoene dehydrogenase-like protein
VRLLPREGGTEGARPRALPRRRGHDAHRGIDARPGFRSDVHASGYQLANLSPGPGELELEKHGLELIEPDLVYAHAFPDGRVLAVCRSLEKTVENIGRYSKKDAETWRACRALQGGEG